MEERSKATEEVASHADYAGCGSRVLKSFQMDYWHGPYSYSTVQ